VSALHPKLITNPWLKRFRYSPEARLRLFCFACAGSGAIAFRSWAENCPAYVELVGIQLPGRGDRFHEPPGSDASLTAAAVASAIRPLLNIPFAFYGHSLGALVSFETARELRRTGAPAPIHLFVAARRSPQAPHPARMLSRLPDEEFLAELNALGAIWPCGYGRARRSVSSVLPMRARPRW
jgi:surfactin synthase thioesterase subunit